MHSFISGAAPKIWVLYLMLLFHSAWIFDSTVGPRQNLLHGLILSDLGHHVVVERKYDESLPFICLWRSQ